MRALVFDSGRASVREVRRPARIEIEVYGPHVYAGEGWYAQAVKAARKIGELPDAAWSLAGS